MRLPGLSKSFGRVQAVSDLSVTVEPDIGFLGPNGAGKTTTLRMVLGLERPDVGIAKLDGPEPLDAWQGGLLLLGYGLLAALLGTLLAVRRDVT